MTPHLELAPATAGAELAARGPWDWLIASGEHESEARTHWSRQNLANVPLLTLRRTRSAIPHHFTLNHDEQDSQDLAWSALGAWLKAHIGMGQRVMIDMSHLGFERMLYLLPALVETQPARLACLYVAPETYAPITDAPPGGSLLRAYPIEQPKGYIALSADTTRPGARHIIVLGFEKGRPSKFIDKYDWDDGHLHLIYGDPAFVENGEKDALASCDPWFGDFVMGYPEHIDRVDARAADALAVWLQRQLAEARWLDIVPLGPKPLCLGVLWFYLALPEAERARVRLLYDFPEPTAPRSHDIGRVLFYDCDHLLDR